MESGDIEFVPVIERGRSADTERGHHGPLVLGLPEGRAFTQRSRGGHHHDREPPRKELVVRKLDDRCEDHDMEPEMGLGVAPSGPRDALPRLDEGGQQPQDEENERGDPVGDEHGPEGSVRPHRWPGRGARVQDVQGDGRPEAEQWAPHNEC